MLIWFFLPMICKMAKSAPIGIEQQILRHFQPSMDKHQLTKVANILTEMRTVMANRNAGNDSDSETDENQTLLKMEAPHIHNLSGSSPTARYLFEGDILLSVPQAAHILHRTKGGNSGRHDRAAVIATENTYWEKLPIRYIFQDTLTSDKIPMIREALEYWQTHTCIKFEEITASSSDLSNGMDHIVFYRGDGCYSMVGRAGGRQGVSVGDQCNKIGLVAHEIGHVLGLWHEQSRPDYSCCIRILQSNIQSGFHINFRQREARETETYGLPYDLGSVMHYRANAFSMDDTLHTIETIDPGYQRTIGQRVSPSFIDVQAINKAYCSGKCGHELPCQYGGYTHPSLCNVCLCPAGIGGTNCEREEPGNGACGGILQVTKGSSTRLTSPNFPQPYGFNQRCSWLIRAPAGSRVKFEFESFDMFCNMVTCMDYVELKLDNTEFPKTGMRYCCNDYPKNEVYSVYNEMLVIFNSEQNSRPGFAARVIQD